MMHKTLEIGIKHRDWLKSHPTCDLRHFFRGNKLINKDWLLFLAMSPSKHSLGEKKVVDWLILQARYWCGHQKPATQRWNTFLSFSQWREQKSANSIVTGLVRLWGEQYQKYSLRMTSILEQGTQLYFPVTLEPIPPQMARAEIRSPGLIALTQGLFFSFLFHKLKTWYCPSWLLLMYTVDHVA